MNQSTVQTIPVVTGIGTGSTALSAFDGALRDAGVANYNLIRLSSVVPAHTAVDATGAAPLPVGSWGDRLDGAGGLFVEHEGDSEQFVADAIEASLADLAAGRPERFGPAQKVLIGTECVDAPVCALVVAAYETAGWGFTR
jgi:arginine decarboxylase